jgi:hypothetical protein
MYAKRCCDFHIIVVSFSPERRRSVGGGDAEKVGSGEDVSLVMCCRVCDGGDPFVGKKGEVRSL